MAKAARQRDAKGRFIRASPPPVDAASDPLAPDAPPAQSSPAGRASSSWDEVDLEELRISPEVAWYCQSRGVPVPTCPPLIKTPEPRDEPGAVFDPDRVDRVLKSFRQLQHVKGRFAGKTLMPDPWQIVWIIAPVFGWVHWDDDADRYVRIITTLYVDLPRKNGKGIYTGEMILTRNGWKKFGDLVVGDEVHSVDGSLVPVTYVSPVHDLDCYEVEFSDGQTVTCDEQHLWTVWDRYGHDPAAWAESRTKGAEVTIDTPTLYAQHRCGSRGDTRYSVRMDRVLDRPEADLPLDPYLLGAWLGDGSTDQATIHGVDDPILDRFRAAGYTLVHRGRCSWGIKPGFLASLRELGVLGNKHVPEEYLLASEAQRLELLRGLMDTDGGVNKGKNTPRVEFTSTLRGLAEAVLFLARSLGWKATIREGRSKLNGVDHGPKWRVTWTAYRDRSPFYLDRKTRALAEPPEKPTRSATNTIVAVRKVESVPTKCIQVDHPSHLFLVGEGLIPTHNTTIAGGLGLYLTAADGEAGAQVLACATTRDQARFAFDPIRQLAESSPGIRKYLRPLKGRVTHPRSGSYFQPVANVGDAQHGADLHGAIVDELHLHKSMELIEAVETGTGSRSQPLIIFITTADAGKPNTPYAQKRERVEKLARGVLKDAATYGVIWAVPDDADPFDEETWKAANPGYGVSPTRRYLREKAAVAQTDPVALGSFKRLHLGIRTRQVTRYIKLEDWDANAAMVDELRLKGRRAYGGLDLASVSDITALAWIFPDDEGGHDVIWRLWAPEAKLDDLNERTANAAGTWVKAGILKLTPGAVTDYDFIESQIQRDAKSFDVVELAYDPWNSSQLITDLVNDGLPVVEVRQGFASLSPALKEVHRLLLVGANSGEPKLRHGGNPAMRWMLDNLAVAVDPSGNVKPDKANAADKIDGVSALVTGMARAMKASEEPSSAYDDGHDLMIV